ncbi:MAG: hypothetical protein Q8K13_18390 [Parvibaculum sp.]|uniref:hypothetical protein n=1 Tax=Parvibaculum sp. TaxID=2024848 RepID=UPI0027315D68|nr:hypothetical protein [Parvibaculum sp.]MDP2151606.1 hypothetical protein [Parvibaculum sp.]
MKIFLTVLVAVFLIFSASVFGGEKEGFKFKNNPEVSRVRPKKPVKVKLRRLSGGRYTWELSGDDIDEMIKTDKRLRKSFGTNGEESGHPSP